MATYAYVTAGIDQALVIIDASDPENPSFESKITTGLQAPYRLHVVGNYAYVAEYTNDALVIFDISDPANPSFKGSITGGGVEPWLDGPRGVYCVEETPTGISGLNPALMEVLVY